MSLRAEQSSQFVGADCPAQARKAVLDSKAVRSQGARMAVRDRIQNLANLGYHERDAEFLCLVALHSGHFVRRQHEAFAGVMRGGSSARFLERVLEASHVRSARYSNRTQVYHLFARSAYRAIGEEDNRHRRARPNFSVKAKLMALDYVLAHRGRRFLAAEEDKIAHLCGDLGIAESKLPAKTYKSNRSLSETRRCFIEKYPIFVESKAEDPASASAAFCYVDEGALSISGFDSFLRRYRRLFVALRRFRVLYVAAEHRPFR